MFYENHADKAWHADDTDETDDRRNIILERRDTETRRISPITVPLEGGRAEWNNVKWSGGGI